MSVFKEGVHGRCLSNCSLLSPFPPVQGAVDAGHVLPPGFTETLLPLTGTDPVTCSSLRWKPFCFLEIYFFMSLHSFNSDSSNFLNPPTWFNYQASVAGVQLSHHAIDLLPGPFTRWYIHSTSIKLSAGTEAAEWTEHCPWQKWHVHTSPGRHGTREEAALCSAVFLTSTVSASPTCIRCQP